MHRPGVGPSDPATATAGCLVTVALCVLLAATMVVVFGIVIYAGSPGSSGVP